MFENRLNIKYGISY